MFQIGSDRWHFLYFILSVIILNTITIITTISTQFSTVTATISNIQKTINMSSSSFNEKMPFASHEPYLTIDDNSMEEGNYIYIMF